MDRPTSSTWNFQTPVDLSAGASDDHLPGDLFYKGQDDEFRGIGGEFGSPEHTRMGVILSYALIRHPERPEELISIPILQYERLDLDNPYRIRMLTQIYRDGDGPLRSGGMNWDGWPHVQSLFNHQLNPSQTLIEYGGTFVELGTTTGLGSAPILVLV